MSQIFPPPFGPITPVPTAPGIPSIIDPFSTPTTVPSITTTDPFSDPASATVASSSSSASPVSGTESVVTIPASASLERPTSTEITALSTGSHNHAGAIAGGVIGGLALIAALLFCLLFYRSRRRQSASARRQARSPSLGAAQPKYDAYAVENGVLGEPRDSKKLPSRHSSSASAVTMVNSRRDSYAKGRTQAYSSEDVSIEDDKSFSAHGHILPTLESVPTTPTSVVLPVGRVRTKSLTNQNRAAALAKLDASEPPSVWSQYAPRSPDSAGTASRRQSIDARFLSSPPSSPNGVPPTTVEMARMSRSSSGGAKRANRKAVPRYDETEFSSPVSATSPSREATFDETYLRIAKSRDDLVAAGLEVPQLNHKSSFGEAQSVHYLMPDLPPPQKD